MDALRNPLLLSVPLGRWFGLPVRLSALAICVLLAIASRYPLEKPKPAASSVPAAEQADPAPSAATAQSDGSATPEAMATTVDLVLKERGAAVTDAAAVADAPAPTFPATGPVVTPSGPNRGAAEAGPATSSVRAAPSVPSVSAAAPTAAPSTETPATTAAPSTGGGALLGVTLAVLLLASVLLHELAEAAVVQSQGGRVAAVVVWPAGGCVVGSSPPAFLGEVAAAAVGPAIHVLICLLMVPLVILNGDSTAYNPFALPAIDPEAGRLVQLGLLLFVVNWKLLWLSLLPLPPLDGSRIIQAYRAETRGRRRTTALKWSLIGIVGGLVILAGLGPMFGNVWLTLLGGCLLVVNMAEHTQLTQPDRDEDGSLGYDFSQGYTSLEDSYDDDYEDDDASSGQPPASTWQKWKQQREQKKLDRDLAERAAAESELDRLLQKISQVGGVDKLTADEQRTLKRLSARFKG